MPVSSGSAGGVPGLTLKAWALFSGSAGGAVVDASQGVLSILRSAAGDYTINFSAALPSSRYLVEVRGPWASMDAFNYIQITQRAAGSVRLWFYQGGSQQDLTGMGLYVAVYA